MSRSSKILIGAMVVLFATAACLGSAAPSLPTLSPNELATVVAATMQVIQPPNSPTPLPPTIPPTPIPPTFPVVAPTAVMPSATRINFQSGATFANVSDQISPGQTQYYVIQALQGQPMMLDLGSLNNDVTLSVLTQGGTTLLSSSANQSTWQGQLPATEDYYLGVIGGASTEDFNLSITIPARIVMSQSTDKAIVSGQTLSGYNVSYVAFAIKGQTMYVDLSGTGGKAALTIYGYADGQPYLRSVTGTTNYSFTLPSTQDYIIEVVPVGGEVVNFTMIVKIK